MLRAADNMNGVSGSVGKAAREMRRVLILGCGGSGKSTLARQLGALLDLPVVHLDCLFWNPGWIPTPDERFIPRVAEAAAGERWVIDGNYTRALGPRLAKADTVIYLDFPRWLCITRIVRRTFVGELSPHPRPRMDLPPDCRDCLEVEFIEWVWNYPTRARPQALRLLDELRGRPNGPRVIVLRTPREVRQFTDFLNPNRASSGGSTT
jgi:adenylate kinase family enzyme